MPSQLRSKFLSLYERLLQGQTAAEIIPNDPIRLWTDLFCLDVDGLWLSNQLQAISHEDCTGRLKNTFHELFTQSLYYFRTSQSDDVRKGNALVTLAILTRAILTKQLAGWEVMDVLTGTVSSNTDVVFTELVEAIDNTLRDQRADLDLRHRTLQLAVLLLSGINQLSIGAYFLRRDLFPTLATLITSSATSARFSFESFLLLALLSNYHKADAGELNPYLRRIRDLVDEDLMKRLCWITGFSLEKTAQTYQALLNDSSPSFAGSLVALTSSLQPKGVTRGTGPENARELYKKHPIEAAVMLQPLSEFLLSNPIFCSLFASLIEGEQEEGPGGLPCPLALLSTASYILTHASSTTEPRPRAYARLIFLIFRVYVSERSIIAALCKPSARNIRLCRQRLPNLSELKPGQPPLCALFDCCILWMRHNLHKKLEVTSYIACVEVAHRAIYFLAHERMTLDFHWEELWRAALATLEFLISKQEDLRRGAITENLILATSLLLEYSVYAADLYLPNAPAVNQLIYQLVRSANAIHRLPSLVTSRPSYPALKNLVSILQHYEELLATFRQKRGKSTLTASDVMHFIDTEVEKNGIWRGRDWRGGADEETSFGTEAMDSSFFVRWVCEDGLGLMPAD